MFRSLVVALFSISVVISSMPPAEGVVYSSPVCEDGFNQMSELVASEERGGVTSEWLDEMHDLFPLLLDCVTGVADDGDKTRTTWGALVAEYFVLEDVPRAICLMKHESKGIASAVNPTSGAAGLMQVMPFWAARFGYRSSDLLDPVVNLQIASWIRDSQGWSAWSPYNRGLCR